MADPVAPQSANDDAKDIVASIRNVFEHYFDTFDGDGDPLKSDRTKVHVGIYAAYDPKNRFPVSRPIDSSKPKGIASSFQYRLMVDTEPVPWIAEPESGDAKVDPKWQPSGKYSLVHLWHTRAAFDPVTDATSEMRAAGFPYAEALGSMSAESRQVYGSNLDGIIDVPEGLRHDSDGPKFLKALAEHATYDSAGNYYPKWQSGKEGQAPLWDSVTQQYFSNVAREVQLYEDYFYVLRQNELSTEIDMLWLGEKHELQRFRFFSQTETRHELTTHIRKAQLHDNFVFIYALHGQEKTWIGNSHPRPWGASYTIDNPKGHSALRRMVDVRGHVEAACSDETTGSELGLKDEFDWFVEWVRAVFPQRLTVIDLKKVRLSKLTADGVRMAVGYALAQANYSGEVKGPFDELLMDRVLEMQANADVLVLPQGLKTGDHTRFVGGGNDFLFERDLKNGSVYKVVTDVYLRNLAIGRIALEVYDSTRGMLPFIEAVVWGGVVAMGAGIVGVSPAGIRAWLVQQAESRLAREVVGRMVKKFLRPAIATLVVELLAYLFKLAAKLIPTGPQNDTDGQLIGDWEKYCNLVQSFARGFFRGYFINTLTDRIYEHVIVDTAKKGIENIREVRMYMLMKRAYAAVDRVRDVVKTIEDQLDGPVTQKATHLLDQAVTRLARGAALLFSVAYHLPHDNAKDLLDVFGLDVDGKPPDPEHWAGEANQQLKNLVKSFEQLTGVTSIDAAVNNFDLGQYIGAAGMVLVLESEIIWAAEHKFKSKHPAVKAFIIVALVALGGEALVAADDATDGKVWKVGKVLLSDLAKLPQTPEGADRLGELVGNVFGALFFNAAVFDKKNVIGGWMDKHAVLGGTLWGNVKASPIEAVLTLLLQRYVAAFDRIRKDLSAQNRAAGEDAFVSAVHAVQDKHLDDAGFGHLRNFRTEDESQLSLQNVALAILRVRHVVHSDFRTWLETTYGDDVARYREDVAAFNELAKSAGYDFHQIAKDEIQDAKNMAKMEYHFIAAQFHAALDEISGAIRSLFEPFTKGQLSWVTFLKALGLDLGDVSKVQQLLLDEAKQELAGLRKSS